MKINKKFEKLFLSAVGTDKHRYALTGVFVKPLSGDAVEVVATDTHTLIRRNVKAIGIAEGWLGAILTVDAYSQRLMDGPVLNLAGLADVEMVNGLFPQYEKVIPPYSSADVTAFDVTMHRGSKPSDDTDPIFYPVAMGELGLGMKYVKTVLDLSAILRASCDWHIPDATGPFYYHGNDVYGMPISIVVMPCNR